MNINLTNTQIKDIQEYCKLNNIEDVDFFIRSCFIQGYNIKKYGMLGGERIIEKEVEVIKEVPVEIIKEVEVPGPVQEIEVIKYVDREVVKEVNVEVPVEKIVYIYDKKEEEVVPNLDNICDEMKLKISQQESEIQKVTEEKNQLLLKIQQLETQEGQGNKEKMLQQTLVNLKKELSLSSEKIKELEKINEQLKTQQPIGAVFMKGSNLNQ
jgi:hypothetical protein